MVMHATAVRKGLWCLPFARTRLAQSRVGSMQQLSEKVHGVCKYKISTGMVL